MRNPAQPQVEAGPFRNLIQANPLLALSQPQVEAGVLPGRGPPHSQPQVGAGPLRDLIQASPLLTPSQPQVEAGTLSRWNCESHVPVYRIMVYGFHSQFNPQGCTSNFGEENRREEKPSWGETVVILRNSVICLHESRYESDFT